jgi:hypothetical protein
MAIHGTWFSYSGAAQIVLAVVLAAAAAAVAYAGIRLPLPARLPTPGRAAKIMMLAIWGFAVVALLVCFAVYVAQAHHRGLRTASPVTPVTLTGVAVLFIVIACVENARGSDVAVVTAALAAVVGPMIFEVPFDLIIMARTYPVIDPALFRLLLFGPLILTGVATVALLSLSPVVRLRRTTLWCFAGMLAVFAAWSLFDGFRYPSAPGPITLNAVSKVLALVTALTLFLPHRVQSETQERVQEAAAGST